jgi:DNA-binding MarR family transcriptional regulator
MPLADLATALRQEVSLLSKYLRLHTPSARHLSLTETTVLSLLQQHGSLLATDLTRLVKITPPSMSQVLGQLRTRGLIVRQPSAHDKRKQPVRLTPAGQAVVAIARHERDTWLTTALAQQLSAAEQQQLAAALPLLERLRTATQPPLAASASDEGQRSENNS